MTEQPNVWADPGHDDWAGIASRTRPLVGRAANRKDVGIRFVLDRARPAAVFVPNLAQVQFTAPKVLAEGEDDPGTIDPCDPADQADFPAFVGVATHEAGHAAHSHITFPEGTPGRVTTWAMLIEEPRMEAALVARRPHDRRWLKAAAVEIASEGAIRYRAPENCDPAEAAFRSAVLLIGRAHAGVLTDRDVEVLREEVAAVITDDTLTLLEAQLADAVDLEDGDTAGLLAAAENLLALLDETTSQDTPDEDTDGQAGSTPGQGGGDAPGGDSPGEGTGPSDASASGESGQEAGVTGTPGTGEGGEANGNAQQMPCGSWTDGDLDDGIDPFNTAPEQGGPLDDQIADAAQITTLNAADRARKQARQDITPPTPPGPSRKVMAERAAEQQAHREAQTAWSQACGTTSRGIHCTTHRPDTELIEQSRALTRVLRREQVRGVAHTRTASLIPPGRLMMGPEVQRRAQIAARTTVTATPYRQTHRREITDPPLVVGFAGDCSGSMSPWQTQTSRMAWAIAHSLRHLDGTVASVAWDTTVKTIIKPGAAPRTLTVAECTGGSTGCPEAIDALDGALNLATTRDAAKALVIVTDGVIADSREHVIRKARRLAATGVAILWVTPRPDYLCTQATNLVLDRPDQFGTAVGKSLAKVLADA